MVGACASNVPSPDTAHASSATPECVAVSARATAMEQAGSTRATTRPYSASTPRSRSPPPALQVRARQGAQSRATGSDDDRRRRRRPPRAASPRGEGSQHRARRPSLSERPQSRAGEQQSASRRRGRPAGNIPQQPADSHDRRKATNAEAKGHRNGAPATNVPGKTLRRRSTELPPSEARPPARPAAGGRGTERPAAYECAHTFRLGRVRRRAATSDRSKRRAHVDTTSTQLAPRAAPAAGTGQTEERRTAVAELSPQSCHTG